MYRFVPQFILHTMRPLRPPYRVLVVDDLPAVREALRWAFECTDDLIVVGEAQDGQEAIARAAELAPDVVTLDIELPGLNGYSVARSLKQSHSPPIIIFLTVHGDAASRQRAAATGGDGFVEKGEGWPVLIAEIRSLLSNRLS